MPSDSSSYLITLVVMLVLGLGVYIWYAFALSKVFERFDVEPWKAWVPLLNEATVFALGGVAPWIVVLYLIPGVNIYPTVMRIVATHRINMASGKGVGFTVLAALLAPVWATLLATSKESPSAVADAFVAARGLDTSAASLAPTSRPVPVVQRHQTTLHVEDEPEPAPRQEQEPAYMIDTESRFEPGEVPEEPQFTFAALPPSALQTRQAPPQAPPVPEAQPAPVPAPAPASPPPAPQPSAPAPYAVAPHAAPAAPSTAPQTDPWPTLEPDPDEAPAAPAAPARPAAPRSPFLGSDTAPPSAPVPVVGPPAGHPASAPLGLTDDVPNLDDLVPNAPAQSAPEPALTPVAPGPAAPQAPAPASALPPDMPSFDALLAGIDYEPPRFEAPAPTPEPAPAPAPEPDVPMLADDAPDTPWWEAAEPAAAAPAPVEPTSPALAAAPELEPDPVPEPAMPQPPAEAFTPPAAPEPVVAEPVAPEPLAPMPLGSAPVEAAPEPDVPAPHADNEDEDEEFGETIIVDRRPVVRWMLDIDGGESLALTSATVVLGRKPTSEDPSVQALTVPDVTRTLSKVHARLERTDETWTITDLGSTNGVMLVSEDGTEELLEPGRKAPVTGTFVLGKVSMSIGFTS